MRYLSQDTEVVAPDGGNYIIFTCMDLLEVFYLGKRQPTLELKKGIK